MLVLAVHESEKVDLRASLKATTTNLLHNADGMGWDGRGGEGRGGGPIKKVLEMQLPTSQATFPAISWKLNGLARTSTFGSEMPII